MMDPSGLGIVEAIELARGGDWTEFEIVLAQHCGVMAGSLRSEIPDDLRCTFDVEDLLQEMCIRAIRFVPQFDWISTEHFEAWLREIARNCLLDAIRASRRRKRGGQIGRVPLSWLKLEGDLRTRSESPETASQVAHAQQIVLDIRVAVKSLPRRERQVVMLHYLRELDLKEGAKQLNITPGAYRALLQRARQRLKTFLHESAWFPPKE